MNMDGKRQDDYLDINNNIRNNWDKECVERCGEVEVLPYPHSKYRRVCGTKRDPGFTRREDSRRGVLHEKSRRKNVTFDRCPPSYLSSDSDCDVLSSIKRQSSSDSISSGSDDHSVPRRKKASFQNQSQQDLITKAEIKLSNILSRLQDLWLDLGQEDESKTIIKEDKYLMETINLIEFVTDQLVSQYSQCLDSKKSSNLQNSNELLEEELKNAKNKIHCLEAEIKLYSKENNLLNTEVQEMSYKLAVETQNCRKYVAAGAGGPMDAKTHPPETEVFYRNPNQQFRPSDSKSCASEALNNITKQRDRLYNNSGGKHHETYRGEDLYASRREEEMDSIIRDFNDKFRSTNSLNAQFQMYDQQLEKWKSILSETKEEKHQMLQDLVQIILELKAVLKERDHYELILKLILQERANDQINVENLLQNLISKLSENRDADDSNGSWIQTSLLEGAVQALQEQNSTQREDLNFLKHKLSESQRLTDEQFRDLGKLAAQFEAMMEELIVKEGQLTTIKDDAQGRYDKLQEMYNAVIAAKTGMEKSLSEKEEEIKTLHESLKMLRRSNKRQQGKLQQIQKNNNLLVKETKESKNNMDHLAQIISQLRSGLRDQKQQWEERMRANTEDSLQIKDNCEWLKSQMEQLNQQLTQAHERLKDQEMDRLQLAQQLLLAEEERRVVDRKLQELRTALQGDTGLREALIERNEELQMEINRLRQTKISSFIAANQQPPTSAIIPPMETSPAELHSFSVENSHNFIADNHLARNYYTSRNRRGNNDPAPRTAVSLHNGSTK